MIFLIKVFMILNCIDCLRHLKTLKDYCARTPANLEIVDIDDEKNLDLILDSKIEGIPHTICYNIRGEIVCSFFGVKTAEEFDQIVYENRFLDKT
jgi:hypothetical protein